MSANNPNPINPARRGLRRIGFFAPAESEYVQRLIDGLLRFQADRGGCVIRDFRYDPIAVEDQHTWAGRPHPWKDWSPDGLIVSIAPDPGLAEWVQAADCPVVSTSPRTPGFPSVFVCADDVVRLAVEHFHALGRVNMAYVTCIDPDRRVPILHRLLGDNHAPLLVTLLGQNPSYWNAEIDAEVAGDPSLVELLRNAPKPLAVMAMNDDVGRVVCLAANQLGLEIPGDVAVVGVNNTVVSRTSLPPLSSIEMPFADIGYAAMEMLWRILDGTPGPDRVEIPASKLVVRESTSVSEDRETEIARARQVIRDRAFEGVGIEQIADELKISRSTLHRDFSATYGHGPGEELARLRMERAKELLRTTRLPVTHIALLVGYSRASSFATFFRKQTGMTPRAYRVGNRGE